MDGTEANALSEINSFLVQPVVHDDNIELSKKRKLQGELDLPLSKHICGDQSSGPEQEDQIFYTCMLKENHYNGIPNYRSEELEFPDGSTNLDCSVTSLYRAEPEFLKIYSCNQLGSFESEFPWSRTYHQPSTSSGSCGSNSFNTSIQSSDSINADKSSVSEEESKFMDEQLSPRAPQDSLRFEEDQLQDFGKYECSESGTAGIEQCCSDEEINEMMLYTNEESPNNKFILSSGRWNVDKDTQVDAKKPTIDQEFEQYFSMLML